MVVSSTTLAIDDAQQRVSALASDRNCLTQGINITVAVTGINTICNYNLITVKCSIDRSLDGCVLLRHQQSRTYTEIDVNIPYVVCIICIVHRHSTVIQVCSESRRVNSKDNLVNLSD